MYILASYLDLDVRFLPGLFYFLSLRFNEFIDYFLLFLHSLFLPFLLVAFFLSFFLISGFFIIMLAKLQSMRLQYEVSR